MKLALKIWVVDVSLLLLFFIRKPSIYTLFLFFMYLIILNKQIIYMVLDKGNIKLLKQLDKFLEEVRHHFQIHGMIDEAIYDAINQTPNPMKYHGEKMYAVLNASDIQEEVTKFKERTPNRFLTLFLSLSVMMVSYGDKEMEGKSLFLTNLKYLRQEVNMEILNRERIRHVFSGLIFVCLTPVLFLKRIESWSINSLPEMEGYYKSFYGILTATVIFLVTYFSYNILNKLKENSEFEKKTPVFLEALSNISWIKELLTKVLNKNYGRTLKLQDLLKKTGEPYTCMQMMIKRILYGFFGFTLCIFISLFTHLNNKEQLLHNFTELNFLNSSLSSSQVEQIQESIRETLDYYKNDKVDIDEVINKLNSSGRITKKQYVNLTADEIMRRLNLYKREYYKWYELLLALIGGIIFYNIPYIQLHFIKKLREKNMEDEIIQFHTIILMLIHIDRVTIEVILEWLENFAVIFKASIEHCRNEMQNGDMEIIEEIKQRESYEPFRKILENLQISDKIGIEKAFYEIELDRQNYQEKRKLDNEMNISNKAMLGKVIGFLPFMITVALYLIIPFIVEGLTTYMGYIEQINTGF